MEWAAISFQLRKAARVFGLNYDCRDISETATRGVLTLVNGDITATISGAGSIILVTAHIVSGDSVKLYEIQPSARAVKQFIDEKIGEI